MKVKELLQYVPRDTLVTLVNVRDGEVYTTAMECERLLAFDRVDAYVHNLLKYSVVNFNATALNEVLVKVVEV